MESSDSQRSDQKLYEALATQFYEVNRWNLPLELTARLVQLLFLAVEAARCSHRLRVSSAPYRHAWQRLMQAGFNPYHRDALMRAGVQATLAEMPHIGGQSGDFIVDTQPLVDELLEVQLKRQRQLGIARSTYLGRSLDERVTYSLGPRLPHASASCQPHISENVAARAERNSVDADCVALAKDWVQRIGLQLPLDDEYVDRFWPLQAQDVEVAFLYYFAALAHARPEGRQLFAGLQAGAPHILAKWYPPSFWRHLRALGIEGELHSLPSPARVPSLDEMTERLRERYDHQFLYRWYEDAKGNRCWSARMSGAPHAPKRNGDNGSLRSGEA